MVSKPYVCENDETTKDTKAGDDEVEECAQVLGELKPVLGFPNKLTRHPYLAKYGRQE